MEKWRSDRVTDGESGEDEREEREQQWLVQGWRSETESLPRRWGDACWNERFVIFREEPVAGDTTEEVRV